MALKSLANNEWEPSITKVEDTGDAWRVFYNNRIFVETRDISHALAGKLPQLVNKQNGSVKVDEAWQALPRASRCTLIGRSGWFGGADRRRNDSTAAVAPWALAANI